MAENFFKSLFSGNIIEAPEEIIIEFYKKFPDAINVEWIKDKSGYESIFYEHGIEKISKYTATGKWIETCTNFEITMLDEAVKKAAEQHGEIMNVIKIDTIDSIKFEIIIRDRQLKRFLLIILSNGTLQSCNQIV